MALSPYLWPALGGVLSHLAYFNHGEHHLHGSVYFCLSVGAVPVGTILLSRYQGTALTAALQTILALAGSYLFGLYTSLLVYRLWLHPLRNFPGPSGARLSSLWLSTQLSKKDGHIKLHEYHQRYGPFVRTGSSDLSIIHPQAVEAIFGVRSRCTKASWYDLSWPTISLQTMRDPAAHHARRRIWSASFSDKLLRGYEQRVRAYRQKLVDRLSERAGKPLDMREWIDMYSFDVMGDLSFGRGFGSLDRGEKHWVAPLLFDSIAAFGFYLPMWLFRLLVVLPIPTDFSRFMEYCGQQMIERIQNPPEIPDVSSALIAPHEGKELSAQERGLLYGDSRLIILAGSDTTTGTLSTIFYELIRHPQEIEKLRAELGPFVEDDGEEGSGVEFLHSKIVHLDHLNGVINESLRLYPPVPGAVFRLTPPEGIVVDGVHIPGETLVYCPQYAMARSELCYEKPYDFIPERWYSQPELIKDKAAFAPFSTGPYNCIGRPLALMNIRTTVARLIMEFDMQLAPGDDGSRFLGDAQDRFTVHYGALNLVLTRRVAV